MVTLHKSEKREITLTEWKLLRNEWKSLKKLSLYELQISKIHSFGVIFTLFGVIFIRVRMIFTRFERNLTFFTVLKNNHFTLLY